MQQRKVYREKKVLYYYMIHPLKSVYRIIKNASAEYWCIQNYYIGRMEKCERFKCDMGVKLGERRTKSSLLLEVNSNMLFKYMKVNTKIDGQGLEYSCWQGGNHGERKAEVWLP